MSDRASHPLEEGLHPPSAEELLAHLPGMAYVARGVPERPMLYASPAAEDLTGSTPRALTAEGGTALHGYVEARDRERVRRGVERSLATGEPFDLRYRLNRGEVRSLWVRDRGRPLEPARSDGPVIYGFLSDITRLKHLEDRAISSQRKEALGELTGEVAHQFNNLLTAILGPVEFALENLPSEGPVSEELLTARNAVHRGAELNRHLLAFARRQPWSDEVVNLNAVVSEMEGLLRNVLGPGIRIMLAYDPQLCPVGVDPNHIKQVILNLALNARDAMPNGGELVVETGNVDLTPSDLRAGDELSPGPYATLTLRDTGRGIDPEIKSRIFEPFFTTKEGSSGLGLSTAFGIARQAGGFIRIRSVPEKETTVTVYLPSAALTQRTRENRGKEGTTAEDRPRILVVDDDEAVRSVASRILQREGYAVLEARCGEEALRLAGEGVHPIALLVTDVRMPGMRGPELATRIARLSPGVRVLFISGLATPAEIPGVGLDETDAFLPKPFTPRELADAVRKIRSHLPWRQRHPEHVTGPADPVEHPSESEDEGSPAPDTDGREMTRRGGEGGAASPDGA